MPAAAVIPAPIAYIKVVAVKKLVVGFLVVDLCPPFLGVYVVLVAILEVLLSVIDLAVSMSSSFTVKKLECLKQAYAVEYISME